MLGLLTDDHEVMEWKKKLTHRHPLVLHKRLKLEEQWLHLFQLNHLLSQCKPIKDRSRVRVKLVSHARTSNSLCFGDHTISN